MSLNTATAATGNKDFGRVGEGSYPARVVQIVDLGMQQQTDWQTGEDKTWDSGDLMVKPEVYIAFELPTETIEVNGEEKPRWLSKTYILSNHEKASLTGVMAAAGVKSTNVAELLDKPVGITVGTTSGGKDKVTAVAPVMKGMEVAALANPSVVFDLDSPDMTIFDKLPNFIKEKLEGKMGTVQDSGTANSDSSVEDDNDNPFS